MANHKSALKRIRSNNKKRLLNRFQHKTTRNAIKKLKGLTSKKEAKKLLINGFLLDVIEKITDEEIKNLIKNLLGVKE